MRQRNRSRAVLGESANGFRECLLSRGAEVLRMCVLPAHKQKRVRRDGVQDLLVPLGRTLRPRWCIAALCLAGVAEAHWNQCKGVCVVEIFPGDTHPLAKMIARGVIPSDPRFVHLGTGRLSDDHNSALRRELNYRPRPEGKVLAANLALSDLLLERAQRNCH